MIREEKSPERKARAEKIAKNIHMDLLREGKPVYLNTSGSSMYPFVQGNDTLKVAPVREEDIKTGDIIAVDNEGKNDAWFYVHRVIIIAGENGKKLFITKGDANRTGVDEPVGFEKVVGRLCGFQRDGVRINLESRWWRFWNPRIAYFSRRYPNQLRGLAFYISFVIEWRRFFIKLWRRLTQGDPLTYRTNEVFLICSRSAINANFEKRARDLLHQGINWDLFAALAAKNMMFYLLRGSLAKIDYPEVIPLSVAETLKRASEKALKESARQYGQALRLCELFYQSRIEALPLGGPFQAKRLYGDINAAIVWQRINFMIHERHREKVSQILKSEGYAVDPQNTTDNETFLVKDNAIGLRLHWKPALPDEAWGGLRLREEGSSHYYELGEEDLLLFLSRRFLARKKYLQFYYIAETAEFLGKYQNITDWKEVLAKAGMFRLKLPLYTALYLAHAFFGSYVPQEVFLAIRPGIFRRAAIILSLGKRAFLKPA